MITSVLGGSADPTENYIVIIPAGKWIYSDSVSTPALTIPSNMSGSITITNSGKIAGKGGGRYTGYPSSLAGRAGGPAIQNNGTGSLTLVNTSTGHIGGGGGGGGGMAGGGGAGHSGTPDDATVRQHANNNDGDVGRTTNHATCGASVLDWYVYDHQGNDSRTQSGGASGGTYFPGTWSGTCTSGTTIALSQYGNRIMPGTGSTPRSGQTIIGAYRNGSGLYATGTSNGGNGGAAGVAGGNGVSSAGGGGGGWGAAGGSGQGYAGGAGGAAVLGNATTLSGSYTNQVYGSVA
jgi:hypothetical protein